MWVAYSLLCFVSCRSLVARRDDRESAMKHLNTASDAHHCAEGFNRKAARNVGVLVLCDLSCGYGSSFPGKQGVRRMNVQIE